ncbi:hypothetical protein N8480_01885 [Flavobacteriaceae bacterium]|nr:hypothetical protein [Flavobacteriaceae bacterium]
MGEESNLIENNFDFIIQQINSDYKGYNLQKILGIEVGLILLKGEKFSLKSLLKIFLSFSFKNLGSNCDSFFVLGKHGRKDYKEIVDYVVAQLDESECRLFDFNKNPLKVNLSVSNIFNFLKTTIHLRGLSWSNKLLLASKICFYKNNIDALEAVEFSKERCKNAVLFSSVHPWEAMFLYYFSKKKIETYSLQHGVYFIYKKSKPIDMLLYKNFIAHKHLCWGDYTKKEFSSYGIKESQLLIAGYPRPTNEININISEGNKCIVILGRKVLNQSNINLLNVLIDFVKNDKDYCFYLKLHPSLNSSDFDKYIDDENFFILNNEKTMSEVLSMDIYNYSICVYTTAYYEVFLKGLIAFRFHDDSSELSEGIQNDIFYDTLGLRELFNSEVKKELVDEKLKYIIGYNINNYKKILGNG